MSIKTFFLDSVNGDRPYSSADFAKAFSILFTDGVFIEWTEQLSFAMGNTTTGMTVFPGTAVVKGYLVETTEDIYRAFPSGTYEGQVVLRVDTVDERAASIVVKTDQTPSTSGGIYELPLYNISVFNGELENVPVDVRAQAVPR